MDSPDLSLDVVHGDGVVEVALSGILDSETAPLLRSRMLELFDEGVRRAVLDLAGLVFMDSAGLGVLVACLKRYRSDNGDVDLRNPRRQVRQLLEVTGVGEVFGIGAERQ